MMSIEQVLVWSAILTFVMALAGSYYRNRAWDLEGMRPRHGQSRQPAAAPHRYPDAPTAPP